MTAPTPACTDVHAHIFPAGLPDFSAAFCDPRWPVLELRPNGTGAIVQRGAVYREVDRSYWHVEPRLSWMERVGVDRQVVSPLPVLLTYWAPPKQAAEFARRQNEAIAEFVALAPEQLVGFGTVPLQDTDAAVEELDRILGMGLRGVEIGTRAGEAELDAPAVRPFFTAASEKGIPLLLHAMEGGVLGRMDNVLVRFGVGVPADTAIAAATLFLSGVLADEPALRLCICHGGGSFFWSLPRMRRIVRHELGSETEERLSTAMRRVFVDSASLDPRNLDYLLGVLPGDQVLMGSDFPATRAHSPLDVVRPERYGAIRQKILATNAARFVADEPRR